MTPEEKLERYLKLFKEKHGDRYDYSMAKIDESIPQIAKQRIQVVCQEHGVFDVSMQQVTTGRSKKKLKEVLMENPDLNPEAAKFLGIIED